MPSHRHFGFYNSPIPGLAISKSWVKATNNNVANPSTSGSVSSDNTAFAGVYNSSDSANYIILGTSNTNIQANSGLTSSTGGSQSHENMPPFYALAFIMKL
jgi:microcystin-dependent protein